MTPDPAEIARIEKERREREEALLLLLLLFVTRSLVHARSSIRTGYGDPAQAAADVLLGNMAIHQPGMATRLAKLLAETHSAGYAAAHRIADEPEPPKEGNAAALVALYAATARTVTTRTADTVRSIIDDAQQAARADGLTTQQTITTLSQAAAAAGYGGDNPYALQAGSTLNIVNSYGAGMLQAYAALNVTGMRHVSVIDDSTTRICDERNGLTLPLDDPYWAGNVPSLHWHCRSILWPVFGQQQWSTWRPSTPPAPGFGFNPVPFSPRRYVA